jgi:hypothetical protein
MGNAAVAEDLAGVDDLDELYQLNASETEPEDDEDDDEPDDEPDDEDQGGVKPEGMPHELGVPALLHTGPFPRAPAMSATLRTRTAR